MNVVMILTAVISFAVTALAGKLLIPALRRLVASAIDAPMSSVMGRISTSAGARFMLSFR